MYVLGVSGIRRFEGLLLTNLQCFMGDLRLIPHQVVLVLACSFCDAGCPISGSSLPYPVRS